MLARRLHSRHGRAIAASVAVLAIGSLAISPPSHALGAPRGPSTTPAHAVDATDSLATYDGLRPTTLTLITGDRVRIADAGGGRSAVVVTPPPGVAGRSYARYTDAAGDAHVVPVSMIGLLGDQLDPELFNVTGLVRDGFDDANRATLPLIIEHSGSPVVPTGTILVRELTSVAATAVTVDRTGAAALGATLEQRAAERSFLTGVTKIWLDARVRASLDEVVPQIGAPAAYEAGYDGTGVRVAVLDSGIDTDHPDLAGRVVAAEDFTGIGGTDDLLGHGTHAASIIGGTGAASGGQFRGVAYGVDLINARVLDGSGWGELSTVIAGLEWAAIEQDADVISISANGGESDGTDILSQAIDAVSASEDVLVVASAGNGGRSVETPGSADAALAVGAVDKADVWQEFSAHGPREGRFAIKPEIVAPGLSVTAAISPDAYIGEPVDEFYAELSGTSTSAPVVAGAAALLRHAHPELSAVQLKALLVTSGHDVGASVFAQGGGRVDVAAGLAAAKRGISAVEATAALGVLTFPHDDGETLTQDIRLVNDGATEAHLTLDLVAVDESGAPVPPEMLTVSTSEIVLGPGDTKMVTITADAATGPLGLVSGSLTASLDGELVLAIPVGFEKERESYSLTAKFNDRHGGSDYYGFLGIVEVEDDLFTDSFTIDFETTEITVRVPAGTYSLSFLSENDQEPITYVEVSAPEVVVDRDTVVVLDGRTAEPITVELDVETSPLGRSMTSYRASDSSAAGYILSMDAAVTDTVRLFAAPTEAVTVGEHHLATSWAGLGVAESFHLLFEEGDGIPSGLTYVVDHEDLAEIGMDVHADVADGDVWAMVMGYGRYTFLAGGTQFLIPARSHHHLWVSSGLDVGWAQLVTPVESRGSGDLFTAGSYKSGTVTNQQWLAQPIRPGTPSDGDWGATREGALMNLQRFMVDQDGHYGFTDAGYGDPPVDDITMRLLADGLVIAESEDLTIAADDLPPEPTDYELTLDMMRTADWIRMSPETHTTWRFTSEQPPVGEVANLAVLHVTPAIELGLDNTVAGAAPIQFDPSRADRAFGEAVELADFDAELSIDDGATWIGLPVARTGSDSYEGVLDPGTACGDSCFVSLRTSAIDVDGSAIEQTIIRAYTGRGVAASPTPTLPPTGAGGTGGLTGLGLAMVIIGGLCALLAARRLRSPSRSGG